ncbi:hypothetical protein ACWDSL_06670 [Streptomyces sp. NPDC000941]
MAEPIVIPLDRWYSGQPTSHQCTTKLATGIIVIADRRPFRIDRVTSLPTDQWPDKFVTAWREQGMPDPDQWWSRPYKVSGLFEGPNASDRLHSTVAPAGHLWDVLPGHYAVCHKCFELPPCRHVHNERVMERATERMAADMAILPGSCHGCREPITKRQKSFTFPGPNLIRPDLGDDSAVFHTRRSCYGSLTLYDRKWAAAEPGRIRFFFCAGTCVYHHDGTAECDNPQCVAKGAMVDLVDHRARIWHRPPTDCQIYDSIHAFEQQRQTEQDTCWCLEGAT